MRRSGRLVRVARSWLGTLTAPAPDPRQGLAHAHGRQHELLAQVKRALAEVRASAGRLSGRVEELEILLARLQEQARSQLLAGRDDAARAILARRVAARQRLHALRAEVCALEQDEQRLVLVEQRLATEIESFQARREVIAAQYTAAEAQVRINEALAGVSQEMADLGLALEMARDSAGRMQARAAAIDDLLGAGALENGAQIEVALDEPEVETELADLRRGLLRVADEA